MYLSRRFPAPVSAICALLVIIGIAPIGMHAKGLEITPQACPATQGTASAAGASADYRQPVRVAANPAKGFYSPYFLLIPKEISHDTHSRLRIIVKPNNSGSSVLSDDPEAFEKDALNTICNRGLRLATALNVAALVPAFPRSKGIYTHALSRAAMTTPAPTLNRCDLQLIAMIDDAVDQEAKAGLHLDRRVLMYGFSASGMFTNRFVFLHPERVAAAAYGSPGGWALAPVASWKGVFLPYPIGVGDLKSLTGTSFHLKAVAKVPQFFFLGAADTNDAVGREAFNEQARKLIFDNFGSTLMARWPYTVQMYSAYLPNARLRLYPGVKHETSPEIDADVIAFFSRHAKAD